MFIKRGSGTSQDANTAEAVALTPSEIRRLRLEAEAAKRKRREHLQEIDKLSFNKFPNIMGWYFDGHFVKDFTLHEEYAEYFNEIEDEIDAQKDLIIEETFTEKAYRNFWPPKFIAGKYFRTRGIYLDFKEVKEDPPKTPPNINYERQRGIIGVELGDIEIGPDGDDLDKKVDETYCPPGSHSKKDSWYWCDEKRDFKPKEPEGDYYFADEDKVWRESDSTYRTPYDWYFDDKQGKYFIRNPMKPELYEFNVERNSFKLEGVNGPSDNGLRFNDYYYSEKQRKWLRITKGVHLNHHPNGNREVEVGDRGVSGKTQDDYYYDGETGEFEVKNKDDQNEYYYDTDDRAWKKKEQPYGPGKANRFPHDYEYDLKLGKFIPIPAKECRHVEPNDWYFDQDKGRFNRIDRQNRHLYTFDSDVNIYKLKSGKGPSANGLGPEDYFWDENEHEWKLLIVLKDENEVEYSEVGKRFYLKGDRGKSGKVPDDFYYDAVDGSFFRKDVRKPDQYWYDTVDEVWKKRCQHYGPGYFNLYPKHYYFDYSEGFWFPTVIGKQILAKHRRAEVRGVSDYTPYDYCFVDADGEFVLRDKNTPRAYKYNPNTGVFHYDGHEKKPGKHEKKPKDYFFDEVTGRWLPMEHPNGPEATYYENGRRNNRKGVRGKTGLITDDYFFDFEAGEFFVKDSEGSYEYLPNYGVWKKVDAPGVGTTPAKLQLSEYYWDTEEGAFIPMSQLVYGEIKMNPYTNLWMQKWRCPHDYYWEQRQNRYLRKTAAMIEKEWKAKNPAAAALEAEKAAKEREAAEEEASGRKNNDYERPWLHNYLELAADEIRFEQELAKQTAKKKDEKLEREKFKKVKEKKPGNDKKVTD